MDREYVWLQCTETGDLNYRTQIRVKGGIDEKVKEFQVLSSPSQAPFTRSSGNKALGHLGVSCSDNRRHGGVHTPVAQLAEQRIPNP